MGEAADRAAISATGGSIDLTQGIRATERGNYLVTSPPAHLSRHRHHRLGHR